MAYTATVTEGGGDFPLIDDGLYPAIIADVSEEFDEPNRFKKSDKEPDFVTRFYLTWELTDAEFDGMTTRQYFTIPAGLKTSGSLNKKSNIFALMEVLGFDMEGKFKVDPEAWQGMEAQIMLKAPRDAKGVQEGWPRVTDVLAKAKRARPATAARATGSARKLKDEEDEIPFE